MFHLLPQPWWFLSLSLGGLTGRGFIEIGVFVGCPPGAGPVGLAVAVAPLAGAVECGLSMPMASVVFSESIGHVRFVQHAIFFAVD